MNEIPAERRNMMPTWVKLIISVGIVAVLLFFAAKLAGSMLAVYGMYEIFVHLSQDIAAKTGMDSNLVKGIIVLFTPLLWFGMHWLLFGNKEKKIAAAFLLAMCGSLYFFGIFGATRDHVKPYYTICSDGQIRFSDNPGIDPVCKRSYEKTTAKLVPILNRIKEHGFRKMDPRTDDWFTLNGEPLLFYYKDQKGDLEFYNGPFHHPRNGANLHDVTKNLYQEWREAEDKKAALADIAAKSAAKDEQPKDAQRIESASGGQDRKAGIKADKKAEKIAPKMADKKGQETVPEERQANLYYIPSLQANVTGIWFFIAEGGSKQYTTVLNRQQAATEQMYWHMKVECKNAPLKQSFLMEEIWHKDGKVFARNSYTGRMANNWRKTSYMNRVSDSIKSAEPGQYTVDILVDRTLAARAVVTVI
jgi:hypothetical protein